MWLVGVGLVAVAFAACVWRRDWPSVSFGAAAKEDPSDDEPPPERTAAIGFALPVPEYDDADDCDDRRR